MARSSHKRHRTAIHEAPQETRRKIENLRDGLSISRRERQYRERRQFVDELPPSRMEWSYDFAPDYRETYSLVDGRPADIVQGLPRNTNNRDLRKSDLQTAVHDYFQQSPSLVTECQRRARRRRVIFALQRNKKGSGRGKRHRWTELSKVRCV